MMRVLITFAFIVVSLSISAAADDAKQWEEANQIFEQIQKLRDRYKVWGAIAFALRKTPHGSDVVITSIFLNQKDQQKVVEMALKDCEATNYGSKCTAISFPGCYYMVIGRAPDKTSGTVRSIWAVQTGRSAPDKLIKMCDSRGLACTPPIGGCNYSDEVLRNGFLATENPIPESKPTDWISVSP